MIIVEVKLSMVNVGAWNVLFSKVSVQWAKSVSSQETANLCRQISFVTCGNSATNTALLAMKTNIPVKKTYLLVTTTSTFTDIYTVHNNLTFILSYVHTQVYTGNSSLTVW